MTGILQLLQRCKSSRTRVDDQQDTHSSPFHDCEFFVCEVGEATWSKYPEDGDYERNDQEDQPWQIVDGYLPKWPKVNSNQKHVVPSSKKGGRLNSLPNRFDFGIIDVTILFVAAIPKSWPQRTRQREPRKEAKRGM